MPNRLRIWLVDDDADERFIVETVMNRLSEPVHMLSLEGAKDAIQALEVTPVAHLPHVIVCDISMPGMTGFDFLKWLRQSAWKTLPVVIRSNSALQRDVTRSYELGANAYHTKAASIQGMTERMEALSDYWRTAATPASACP